MTANNPETAQSTSRSSTVMRLQIFAFVTTLALHPGSASPRSRVRVVGATVPPDYYRPEGKRKLSHIFFRQEVMNEGSARDSRVQQNKRSACLM